MSLLSQAPGKSLIPPPLTPSQRRNWNDFIDFLEKKGMKGNPALDQRDKNLGQTYFKQYVESNPQNILKYDDVQRVQQELQDYRTNLVNKWKAGQAVIDGVKNENEIMRDLSKADGWLGSKTSSYKYPAYVENVTKGGATTQTNHGVDKFDEVYAQLKNK